MYRTHGRPKLEDIHRYVDECDIDEVRYTDIAYGKGITATRYETHVDIPNRM